MDGAHSGGRPEAKGGYLLVLALTALGVVFGDIGTSPIYAIREAFHESHGIAPTPENVLGVLSLIFWSLVIVISIKYLAFVMRADNEGEGGIIALTALVSPLTGRGSGNRKVLALVGLFGAALLYGDGMITPAISVVSAVEGLEVATPLLTPYVVPITIAILVGLFALQRKGTAGVGAVFGPITLVWFLTLAVLGGREILSHPGVLAALSPVHGAAYFARNHFAGFFVLGTVFLVVTGGEALYADMGHFGKRPIRLTWFAIVLPSLLLNYFGQGALIINDPATLRHPFFLLAPEWALYPLVALSTAATVIASQAVISGTFSLTRQAVQLGYLPRLRVAHTSSKEIGQVYIPGVNWALMVACIGLVVGFGSSSRLAAAYGVAVTTDMVFTTILFAVVAGTRWNWSLWRTASLAGFFLVVDVAFWAANVPKVPHGGWFPLVVAGVLFAAMTTWKKGRELLRRAITDKTLPVDLFLRTIRADSVTRVPGTSVFLVSSRGGTPPALLHNLKHNKVMHEQVVFMTVVTRQVPRVPREERVELEELGDGLFRVTANYGFAEDPNVPAALAQCPQDRFDFSPMRTTYFLGDESLIVTGKPGMAVWRKRLFSLMKRNARDPTAFFDIPPNRVVELGTQMEF
ncbi:MAG: potassium transporter Kup [Gemmatimonadota bacterium]